jgi:hypothetical protein
MSILSLLNSLNTEGRQNDLVDLKDYCPLDKMICQ